MDTLIKLEDGRYGLVNSAVETIVTIENEIKILKERQDNYKEILLNLMEENDVKEIDIPELKITRRFATTRESLDSKRLKAEQPDLYDEYCKISEVKGSITIKIKEGENNE